MSGAGPHWHLTPGPRPSTLGLASGAVLNGVARSFKVTPHETAAETETGAEAQVVPGAIVPVSEGAAPSRGRRRRRGRREGASGWSWSWLITVSIVLATVAWAYLPELLDLARTWRTDPDYSHGFLVVPVALLVFWRRRDLPNARGLRPLARYRPWHWAWPMLAAALAARWFFRDRGNQWADSITLLPVLAGLALTFGGWASLRRAWPAIGYLAFMVPLPSQVNDALAQPLQGLATTMSTAVLRLTGLWVISEGNVIYLGSEALEVARACNGLSMMMCLAAVVVAMLLLAPMSAWMRVLLFLSVPPVAVVSNVVRISATAWCYHELGAARGAEVAHDAAGWLMMPLALLLVGLEMAVLRLLFTEEEAQLEPTLLGDRITGRARETNQP